MKGCVKIRLRSGTTRCRFNSHISLSEMQLPDLISESLSLILRVLWHPPSSLQLAEVRVEQPSEDGREVVGEGV